MKRRRWTNQEIEILQEKYTHSTASELMLAIPNRTWDAIKLKANSLNLYSEINYQIESDLSILLEDSLVTYYWIGFLMADGYIDHDAMRLILSLAIKDRDHIIKFAEYIKCNNHSYISNYAYGVSAQDKKIIPKIINKYNFLRRKTYNPPNLSYLRDNNLVSFFIGFIDGDGHIRKQYKRNDSCCMIKIHKSWYETLTYLVSQIAIMCNITIPPPFINTVGYTEVYICNSIILKFLKLKTLEWNLPVLLRKWNIIDEHFYSRIENAKKTRLMVIDLHQSGMSRKDIAAQCQISKSYISQILSKYYQKEVV